MPRIRGAAVGDKEDPRAVVGYAVGPVCLLPLVEQNEAGVDGGAHGSIPASHQRWRIEHIRRLEVRRYLNGAERDNRDLNTLGRHRIHAQFILEDAYSCI